MIVAQWKKFLELEVFQNQHVKWLHNKIRYVSLLMEYICSRKNYEKNIKH